MELAKKCGGGLDCFSEIRNQNNYHEYNESTKEIEYLIPRL